MFKKTAEQYPDLKEAINTAIEALSGYDPDSPEYSRTVEQIVKLDEVLNGAKPKKTSFSKDALLGAGVSILGILLVINKEVTGAVTSKAFSMIRKS